MTARGVIACGVISGCFACHGGLVNSQDTQGEGVITAAGGIVEAGAVRVSVPAGDVSTSMTVTITPVALPVPLPPGFTLVGTAFAIGPDVAFAQAVTIWLPAPAGSGTDVVFALDSSDAWQLVSAQISGGVAAFGVLHFGTFAVAQTDACSGVDTQTDPRNCGTCGHECGAGEACVTGRCQETCAPGYSACGQAGAGYCADLNDDTNNCGICGKTCPAGEVCVQAGCQESCASGYATCSDPGGMAPYCANLQGDSNNCGHCGNACPSGEVCDGSGTCAASCLDGELLCSALCTNPQTDPDHCGTCGTACPAGQFCVSGSCKETCAVGYSVCTPPDAAPYCADLQADSNNCGVCGTVCPSGEVCDGRGSCEPSCLAGEAPCGSTCTSLKTDTNNCGSCGRVCAAGQSCASSQCSCPPSTPDACGSGASAYCTNLEADRNNCGYCGAVCPEGEICNGSGACAPTCLSGETYCGTLCTDTQLDALNCGACGMPCAAGQTCSSGICHCPQTTPDACGSGATGYCTNLEEDSNNCGTCRTQCASGEVCTGNGSCAPTCLSGESLCDAFCTDTESDPNNCGNCDDVCAAGETCSGGHCGCPAATPNACGAGVTAYCTALATDSRNCGTCGNKCASGEICSGSGECAPSCLEGETYCGSFCTQTLTDPNNCDSCGNVCPSGQTCSAGSCGETCATGFTSCGAYCANLATDSDNCGFCGMGCPAGKVCNGSGICAAMCLSSETLCAGLCTSTTTDPLNCGGCGLPCAPGQLCSDSACSETCSAGYTTCGTGATAYCALVATDNSNCGTCGRVCPAGEACSSGSCVTSCLSTELLCDGLCTNPQTDPLNCGGCGAPCASGQLCSSGSCVETCAPTEAACPASSPTFCTTLDKDPDNCGSCGKTCLAGQACVMGTCSETCLEGFATCPGGCARLSDDVNNCMTCGNVCPAGQLCSNGCSCPSATPNACGSGTTAFCTDFQTDPDDCGGCGGLNTAHVCGPGTSCEMGVCASACDAPQSACPGTGVPFCTNTSVDGKNCGACGAECATNASCGNSLCFCPAGTTACGGAVSSSSAACVPTIACFNGQLPTDCAQLLVLSPTAGSGTYMIDPDGSGPIAPFPVYCDMTSEGGGWTLVLKADGTESTASRFAYGSSLWTTTTTTDPNYLFNTSAADLSRVSAKLPSFNTLPLTQVRLGMSDSTTGSVRYVQFTLPPTAAWAGGTVATSSLRALFAANTPLTVAPTPTPAEWMGLMSAPNLQTNCNVAGVDIASATSAETRLGIVGSTSFGCGSPTSYIGIGNADPDTCNGLANAYVGNMSGCNSAGDATFTTGGNGTTPAFAYVFVRNNDFRTIASTEPSCEAHFVDEGRTISGLYTIQPNPNVPPYAVYCNMTADGGGWTMAYKFSAGATTPAADANVVWNLATPVNESQPSYLNVLQEPQHYLSRLVTTDWTARPGFAVSEARATVYYGEDEGAFIRFNASGSPNKTSWFAYANVLESSWIDLAAGQAFFSIAGDTDRKWFIENESNACSNDTGWLDVSAPPTESCPWEVEYAPATYLSQPQILYSSQPTKQEWQSAPSGSVGEGTTFVVYVR